DRRQDQGSQDDRNANVSLRQVRFSRILRQVDGRPLPSTSPNPHLVIPVLVAGIHHAVGSGVRGWLDSGDKPRYDSYRMVPTAPWQYFSTTFMSGSTPRPGPVGTHTLQSLASMASPN